MTLHRLGVIALWLLAVNALFVAVLWLAPLIAEAVRRRRYSRVSLEAPPPPSLESMKRARLEVVGRLSEYRQRRGQ